MDKNILSYLIHFWGNLNCFISSSKLYLSQINSLAIQRVLLYDFKNSYYSLDDKLLNVYFHLKLCHGSTKGQHISWIFTMYPFSVSIILLQALTKTIKNFYIPLLSILLQCRKLPPLIQINFYWKIWQVKSFCWGCDIFFLQNCM